MSGEVLEHCPVRILEPALFIVYNRWINFERVIGCVNACNLKSVDAGRTRATSAIVLGTSVIFTEIAAGFTKKIT
jgi:hypothetical protein